MIQSVYQTSFACNFSPVDIWRLGISGEEPPKEIPMGNPYGKSLWEIPMGNPYGESGDTDISPAEIQSGHSENFGNAQTFKWHIFKGNQFLEKSRVQTSVLVQEHDVLLWELFHHENICSLDGKSESTSSSTRTKTSISGRKLEIYLIPSSLEHCSFLNRAVWFSWLLLL